MKVLVAGGAGYIGSVTAVRFAEEGHEVVVLDDLRNGHADAAGDLPLVDLPISRAGEVLDETFDLVVHLAADALVGESVEQPEKYWANNLGEGLALLDAMRAHGVGKIIFSSTCATYGQPETLPITEDTPTRPVNAYGMTKLAFDHALSSYAVAHDLAAVSFRYFNVVGAYAGRTERHEVETHLVPNLLKGAAGQTFTIFGTDFPTPDGTAIRDYVHVVDLADAHLAALAVLEPGVHHIINLGSGGGYSVREVLDAVQEVTGHTIAVEEAPPRPGDPAELVADASKAKTLIGWEPTRSLKQAIADAWEARDA
ncbi:UDP-glucose 4-epimerase GalE [Euzebya tangerina]|uniref:UDP-glucose 4-epimerase GalE n=1 Tax=Euzebya tangerina TaxID=591198 RepID=UPI000E31DC75|nr:UDP-glucose 4-epimerase GalE [Euzebya tangerina]